MLRFSALFLTLAPVQEPQVSKPDVLRVGHVVEIRGSLGEAGRFMADKIELKPEATDDALLGTVPDDQRDPASFMLLGQLVVTDEATVWKGIAPGSLAGKHIKVEGSWKGPRKFLASQIAERGAGRDRIAGRLDELKRVEGGWEARLMIFSVALKDDTPVEHEREIADYGLAKEHKVNVPSEHDETRNEDELFGSGLALTNGLRLSGQVEVRPETDRNFDLNDAKQADRKDYLIRYRMRFDWKPSALVTGRLELRYDQLWRDDQRTGNHAVQNGFLGEVYLRGNDLFGWRGFGLTAGREKFSDLRRWIYHQNLDGLHMAVNRPGWAVDLAAAEILDDGSPRDKESQNLVAYASNNDDQEHLAVWALYRAIDASRTTTEESNFHFGVRAIGEFLPQNESWFDFAYELGSRDDGSGSRSVSAWGYDAGTTWAPPFISPLYFTCGYALGNGDSSTSGTDGTFRQTGFQDNKGKFGGVSSFRYYGELVDPELSNLGILTLGIGARIIERTSLDLIYHTYTQDVANTEFSQPPVQSNLKTKPNGINAEIGSELDVILGFRRFSSWDLAIVGAWFQSGDAFDTGDDAFLGKIQLRYRL